MAKRKKDVATINSVIKKLSLDDDAIILLRKKSDKPTFYKEYKAGELKGDKRQVYFARTHQGGIQYNYNAILIVTER